MGDRSSTGDLSSAPSSDIEDASMIAPPSNTNSVHVAPVAAPATRQDPTPVKRRPRKKKEIDPNAPPAPPKEKKPRKPRTSAVGTAARATKKQKIETDASISILSQDTSPATNLGNSRLVQPTTFVSDNSPPNVYEAAKTTQNGFSNPNPAMNSHPQSPTAPRYNSAPQPQPPAPRVRSVFDPVRGIERAEQSYQPPTLTPPRPTFRPSASPAISSIINPPDVAEPKSSLYQITSSQSDGARDGKLNGNTPSKPMADIVSAAEATAKKPTADEKPPVETESKQKRAKEQPPPTPIGSGLLNSTFFGGDSSSGNQIGKGVNIVLQIDLSKEENKIFNFSRMAEEKYGFAAVYPRQAAQKERLAKVAAAGAALEKAGSNGKRGELSVAESGDEDLSVDIDRDSDNDGDVNMTGLNGTNENSGTDGPAVRQRRKRKDEYDADDPFVDDSEALWEAQAAASKDGFFVYMGALVTEEKGASDKTDGPPKRGGGRGRGRGGGPGSRGGRGAASSAAAEGSSRGGGPGSRGGGTTRKPRITKQERQQRELEKKQREQAGNALATKVAAAPV